MVAVCLRDEVKRARSVEEGRDFGRLSAYGLPFGGDRRRCEAQLRRLAQNVYAARAATPVEERFCDLSC